MGYSHTTCEGTPFGETHIERHPDFACYLHKMHRDILKYLRGQDAKRI